VLDLGLPFDNTYIGGGRLACWDIREKKGNSKIFIKTSLSADIRAAVAMFKKLLKTHFLT